MSVAPGEEAQWAGPPETWRSYRSERRVRLGDVAPTGEVRLDAVARYLQDVAADDVRDAGLERAAVWVVRRTELRVTARPIYGQAIDLVTWCAGTGPAWAARRTAISSGGEQLIEALSLWVSLDPRTRQPAALDERFFEVYGEEVRSRSVKARLQLPPDPPPAAERVTWPLRRADLDLLGHVNNAVAWAVVEEEAFRAHPDRRVGQAALEYRQPIDEDEAITVVASGEDDGDDGDDGDGTTRTTWLLDGTGEAAVVAAVELTTD